MRPAAFIYRKIRYGGVFEEGAVIGGHLHGATTMSDHTNRHGWARPRFDPTINYGHVLTVRSFLVAAASALYSM
jgi:hypothetical protein